MPIQKLNPDGSGKVTGKSYSKELAGVPTDPGNHYGKGRTVTPEEYEFPRQTLFRSLMNKVFGRK